MELKSKQLEDAGEATQTDEAALALKNTALRQKTKRMNRLKEDLFVWAIVAFPLILFCVFYIGDQALNVVLAFQEYDVTAGEFKFLPFDRLFDNFARFFTTFFKEEGMAEMAWRSLGYWAFTQCLLIPHILVSFCIYKKVRFTEFFKIILFLPQIISGLVWTMLYRMFVEYGMPVVLGWFGKELEMSLFMSTSTVFYTMAAQGVWTGFAGGLILYTGAMSRIPPELVEAGKIDGLTTMKEFWHITMPLIFPTVSIHFYTCVAGIFSVTPGTYTYFGGNAPIETYTFGYYFFNVVFGQQKTPIHFSFASATSLIFSAICIPVSFFIRWIVDKYGPNAEF